MSELRLAGVDGPYSVLLSADVHTKVSETSDHGYPIREHLEPAGGRGHHLGPGHRRRSKDPPRRDFDLPQLGTDATGHASHATR